MIWLLSTLLALAEPKKKQEIYVAPPTIHDEQLQGYQAYINSMLVSSANVNTHWVKRTKKAEKVYVYDKHTIAYALDTTCNYNRPLQCGNENYHWVLVTDIFATERFATVVVKLYDEETQLIASATKSSYSVEKCKEQVKQTTIQQMGRPKTEITEKLPDKCIILKPSVMDKDIKQAISILFASIHPD